MDIDIIYEKFQKISIDNNIIFQKADLLIKTLRSQLGENKLKGIQGACRYISNLINLLMIENTNEESKIINVEAMMLTLSISVRSINDEIRKFTDRLLELVNIYANIKNEKIHKYLIIILEHILLHRTQEEISSGLDESCYVFEVFTLENIIFSREKEAITQLIKTYSKLFKRPVIIGGSDSSLLSFSDVSKFTLMKNIVNKLIIYLKGIYGGENDIVGVDNMNFSKGIDSTGKVTRLTNLEAVSVLDFLIALIQIFPIEYINDINYELNNLLINEIDEVIYIKVLSVIELSFSTKALNQELTLKFLDSLLESGFLLENYNLNNASLITSFIKTSSQILINLSKSNIKKSMKYLPSLISIIGEITNEDNFDMNEIEACEFELPDEMLNQNRKAKSKFTQTIEFIKSVTFSCLSNLINKLFSDINIQLIKKSTKEANIDDLEIEEDENIDTYLNNFTSKLVLLSIPDYHKDTKPGFELIYLYIERLSKGGNGFISYIQSVFEISVDYYINTCENKEKQKNLEGYLLSFKVFFSKAFNIIPASFLSQFLRLDLLSFDLSDEDYTEISRVWIIAYIEKFYKNFGTQTIADYSEYFQDSIKEILSKITLLKRDVKGNSSSSQKDEPLMMIDEEDMDEKFNDNSNSKHYKLIKIQRYQLILYQIFGLLPLFSYIKNKESTEEIDEVFSYIEVISLSIEQEEDKAKSIISKLNIFIFRTIQMLIENIFSIRSKLADSTRDKYINTLQRKEYIPHFFNKTVKFYKDSAEKSNSDSELKSCLLCLTAISKIIPCDNIYSLIGIEIESFNNLLTDHINHYLNITSSAVEMNVDENDSNIAQLNTGLDKNKGLKSIKIKELKAMGMKIQLINHLSQSIIINLELFDVLSKFFDHFFKSYTATDDSPFSDRFYQSHEFQLIVKGFLDLAIILVHKSSKPDKSLDIFSTIWSNQGLKLLSSKQKVRIFSFILNIIKTEYRTNTKFDISYIKSHFHTINIIIEIATLTKDINKKVRNSVYDLISDITLFMKESGLFQEWINLLYALLVSDNTFLISGTINLFSRVFWEEKTELELLCETADALILMIRKECKEITKALFLFIRVLVYIIGSSGEVKVKKSGMERSYSLLNFTKNFLPMIMNSTTAKEFKVKVRNLVKSLLLKMGTEPIREIIGKENLNLITYINKHIIKKANKFLTEEEVYYKNKLNSNIDIGNESVMDNNDENIEDEEEEFINQEFKKKDKKQFDDELDVNNIDKWIFDEEDEEERKRKEDLVNSKPREEDKLEKLFNSSDHHLQNFFYMNPYANFSKGGKEKERKEEIENDKDVMFDNKKQKLIVKDIKNDKDSKQNKNTLNATLKNEELIKENEVNLKIKRKRINFDEEIVENKNDKEKLKVSLDDDIEYLRRYNVSNKDINAYTRLQRFENQNVLNLREKSSKKLKAGDTKKSHFVKFTGDEYKSSVGKGDKLLKGKYEPFAYIQLNPKAAIDKNNKSNIKVFEKIMKNK